MNRTPTNREAGWFFATLFALCFCYMGALSAALEGWDLMFTICAWSGTTIMVAAAIASIISLFRGVT